MRESQTGFWQTVGGRVDPDEVAELRRFHVDELAMPELDPLNRHLLRDTGLLNGPAG